MHQVHEILAGDGGRLFGDRRLRVPPNGIHHHQPLKCPRCDSLNTKFCYYNNYNLSQPRHFCKNCRRYWTKGGVLRNVPVGGGCRKSKRATKRKDSSVAKKRRNSNSRSSSEIGNGSEYSSQVQLQPTFNSISTTTSFGLQQQNQVRFGDVETTSFGMQQQNQLFLQSPSDLPRDLQKDKIDDWASGIFDQTVQNDGDLAVPDWNGGGGGHLGMFDLTPGSDWSQSSQWNETDHHLYLPP